MEYSTPCTCVWEITMGCNMRCKHCGSICENALPDELSTEEAFKFIDMCVDIGIEWISISGGEPFTRRDLIEIVEYARKKGIMVNIITNGWLIDEDAAKRLGRLDCVRVLISLDGPKEVHDFIRKPGAFERALKSYRILKSNKVELGCITTLTKKNINHLDELKETLIKEEVTCWQLQIGCPMGNLSENCDWILDPVDVNKVIDYCFKVSMEGKIDVYPADCIGYYNEKLIEIYKKAYHTNEIIEWNGCSAGVNSFGLLHNGDVIGCTSIRNKEFIEGNIRERSLREIWEDPNSFLWRRNFKKEDLKGDCLKCSYAEQCLGGCFNIRFTMNRSFYSENLYCTQNLIMKERKNS